MTLKLLPLLILSMLMKMVSLLEELPLENLYFFRMYLISHSFTIFARITSFLQVEKHIPKVKLTSFFFKYKTAQLTVVKLSQTKIYMETAMVRSCPSICTTPKTV